jgi:hypothetical protein
MMFEYAITPLDAFGRGARQRDAGIDDAVLSELVQWNAKARGVARAQMKERNL